MVETISSPGYRLKPTSGLAFSRLRITHLISKEPVRSDYLVRLMHGHRFRAPSRLTAPVGKPYRCGIYSTPSPDASWLKNGWFSMRCQRAELKGAVDATKYINAKRLQPLPPEQRLLATHVTGRVKISRAER